MIRELKLLLLEDDPADAELIQRLLRQSGLSFKARIAGDEKEFLEAIKDNGYDAVLADNALPQYSSMEALKMIRFKNPDSAFILVTGTVSEEFAVTILQQGADDYILKTNLTRLPAAITKAVEKKRLRKEMVQAEENSKKEKELSDSIINSLPGIFYLYDQQGKLVRCNNNFRMVTGYSNREILNMAPEDFFEPGQRKHITRWIQSVYSLGFAETESLLLTKDGKMIPYYFSGSAILYGDQACLIVIGLDITERKDKERDLQLLNEQLRSLSARHQHIREEEQKRIAREIHDQLGQQITGLKMDVAGLKEKVRTQIKPILVGQKLDGISKYLDEMVVSIRKIAEDLRPSILDDIGLGATLEWQSSEFAKRSGIPVNFSNETVDLAIDPSVATGLFRIFQETLTNIARHSAAKLVTVYMTVTPEKQLLLSISDDGKGFDINDQQKSLGLLGMKERASMMSGTLEIQSKPGQGTKVIVTVSP